MDDISSQYQSWSEGSILPHISRTVAGSNAVHRKGWSRQAQTADLLRLLATKARRAKAEILAENLMREFGSLPAVLAGSHYRLANVSGMTVGVVDQLKAFQTLAEKLAMERIPQDAPIIDGSRSLIDYLHLTMSNLPTEQFRVLFLNKKGKLIADEVQQTGTVDHTPVYPREVIRRSLELSATAMILVHNHPSGDPSPSSADVRMTKEIADVAKTLGIVLHDHIIVGKSGHASMRGLGLI